MFTKKHIRFLHLLGAGPSFWRMQGTKMPEWRKAAKIVFTIPPTSAASERVFSLLEAMFGAEQDALQAELGACAQCSAWRRFEVFGFHRQLDASRRLAHGVMRARPLLMAAGSNQAAGKLQVA